MKSGAHADHATSVAVYTDGEVIGDGIIKIPFAHALKSAFPAARLIWLTAGKTVYSDILRDLASPAIDEIIAKGFQVIEELRHRYLDKDKHKRRRRRALVALATALFVALVAWAALAKPVTNDHSAPDSSTIVCTSPKITDGDTFRCQGLRVRLLGIDAPEMPGSCRRGRKCVDGDPVAARDYLESLTRTTVECSPQGEDRYGRTLARCNALGADLSCVMIQSGHAVQRYSPITCP